MRLICGRIRRDLNRAQANRWTLIATPYVIQEVLTNLDDMPPEAQIIWPHLQASLNIRGDILTLNRPSLFIAAKDRPILFSALAWAEVLLTLDHGDFASLLDSEFYGLAVMKPGKFLMRERSIGRLR